jgi:23S rRNA G2445 N2-methylase RlmL
MPPAARRDEELLVALAGVRRRLAAGARVADVRCGEGTALIELAHTFPASSFHGFDPDATRVARARRAAATAGVSDRVTFETAPASAIAGDGYDVVIDGDRLAGLM